MLRILVVDDDYTSRVQLKAILSFYGDCDAAPDGEIALKLIADALSSGVPYDLITMDMEMPQLSGFDVLSRIRHLEGEMNITGKKKAHIIMITVRDKMQDVIQAYKEECTGYMVKPATPQKMKEVLTEVGLVKG